MAEELLSGSDAEVAEGGQIPPAATTAADGGEVGTSDEKSSLNLDELPEWRTAKSKYDKQISETQKELKRIQAERQQDLAYRQQLEAQLEQFQTQGMDDTQRRDFEIQKRDRQIQALQSMMQQQQMSAVKQQALLNIQEQAREIGVEASLDELISYENADDAWRHLLQKAVQGATAKQQAVAQKRVANAVDLGGGAAETPVSNLQEKYNKALKAFDANAMLKVLDQAAREGVELKID